MSIYKIEDIKSKPVLRLPTCIPELDWIYGYTSGVYGLPSGKMSLWAGEKGTGKSRAAIEVCRRVAGHTYNPKDYGQDRKPWKCNVLYFQKEVDMGTLLGWYKQDGSTVPSNFYPSDSATIDEQCQDIMNVKPLLVIVDSINMLREFRSHSDDAIEEAIDKYRKVCEATLCHIIFLQQLNKDGSPKGSSSIAHLLDVEMILKRMCSDGFSMACPQKNRYGKTGISIWWYHTPKKAQTNSDFRLEDKEYCKKTGAKYRDLEAEGKAFQRKMQIEEEREDAIRQAQEEEEYEAYLDSLRTPLQRFIKRTPLGIFSQKDL